ncbi:hypothetical protein [Streptomyces sp. NPDC047525]|uniref:hypothetical protein n=1 Tax=Streptomyces sp. NPDC047525 TaxID=3155264 RepID=UPI0033BFE23F
MGGNRPTDWHVLDLDKDPTPGDPDRVRNLAKNLHDFADDVSKVLRDIKGMAGEDAILTWAGKTAESFTTGCGRRPRPGTGGGSSDSQGWPSMCVPMVLPTYWYRR